MIMKSKNYIVLVITLLLFSGCVKQKHQQDMKEAFFTSVMVMESKFVCVPMVCDTSDTFIPQLDTFVYCGDNGWLYDNWSIKTMEREMFLGYIYAQTKWGEPILISREFYEQIQDDRVREIPEITALYQLGGVDTLLTHIPPNRFWEWLWSEDEQKRHYVHYVVYLCWQHDLCFMTDDESGCWYVIDYREK